MPCDSPELPRPPSSSVPGGGKFPQTLWSIVLQAGSGSSKTAEDALAKLYRSYWYPLYAYVRRRGFSAPDAEDLTQAFFLHLLNRKGFESVRREKGKFRSFLLASLQHFLADDWKKSQAQKRGGGIAFVFLDAAAAEGHYQTEPAHQLDPEKLFELRWALTLLEKVLSKLESEQNAAGKKDRFSALQPFLVGDPVSKTYRETGEQLGMSEGAVKVAVLRLRERFRELITAEIRQTVANEEEIQEELRYLLGILSR